MANVKDLRSWHCFMASLLTSLLSVLIFQAYGIGQLFGAIFSFNFFFIALLINVS